MAYLERWGVHPVCILNDVANPVSSVLFEKGADVNVFYETSYSSLCTVVTTAHRNVFATHGNFGRHAVEPCVCCP